MAESTHIEWTDATWNPVTGCDIVSPGCTNCYAMRLAGTRLAHLPSRTGLTRDSKAGPVIMAGEKPGGGTKDFSVFIWRQGHEGRPLGGWLRKNEVRGS